VRLERDSVVEVVLDTDVEGERITVEDVAVSMTGSPGSNPGGLLDS
jgi:hypothetical protein